MHQVSSRSTATGCWRLFKNHEEHSLDLVPGAAQGEYICQRKRSINSKNPDGRRRFEDAVGANDDSIEAILGQLVRMMNPEGGFTDSQRQEVHQLATKFDGRTEIADLDAQYLKVVAIHDKPYREREAAWTEFETTLKQKQSFSVQILPTSWNPFFNAFTRNATKRHGTHALVALRRWQLTHTEPPGDLAQVMSNAEVNAVPR